MASVLHAQDQLFGDERMPAEEAPEDAHDIGGMIGLWDDDHEESEPKDEDKDPVFEFNAPVSVVEAERPKQISRWLALRL
eukprot:4633355-Amphidinium_carterae.1